MSSSQQPSLLSEQIRNRERLSLASLHQTIQIQNQCQNIALERRHSAASCQSNLKVTFSGKFEKELEEEEDSLVQSSSANLVTPQNPIPHKVGPADFDILRLIGGGGFGKVYQVKAKFNNEIYAMKVMSKRKIVSKEHVGYILLERDLLANRETIHPFIVRMRYCFQTNQSLYLVMEFVSGGHMFKKLYEEGIFNEEETRFVSAEIVSAITHLHSLKYAHRDLKPENILLDAEGHVIVTDLGLARDFNAKHGGVSNTVERSNTLVGTLEYMAPEIVKGDGHGLEVDWWSLGILMYEMLLGQLPWRNKCGKQDKLQKEILTSKIQIKKPWISQSARDLLLNNLLQKDPSKRPSAAQIMRHPFFKGLDWNKLNKRELLSPFRPKVTTSPLDLSNFDKIWTDQSVKKVLTSESGSPCSPQTNELFRGYSFVDEELFQDWDKPID
eukprot:TRINITY_DN48201_c0_g1_i7.p1 TRINITY_DN48201_c0_g1~~TRINITY_DN48201_c0_g1_i7.p1  ORF type:complete len:441 (+),score=31.45 TRINITY_DN48201_c0_g1_i7:115-1437(+)